MDFYCRRSHIGVCGLRKVEKMVAFTFQIGLPNLEAEETNVKEKTNKRK